MDSPNPALANPAVPATTPPSAQAEDISAWQMLGGALTMLAIGVFVFYQLSRLESGDASEVRVWAPVAAAYHLIGFWPAVSIAPTLSLYMAWLAGRRALEESAPSEAMA